MGILFSSIFRAYCVYAYCFAYCVGKQKKDMHLLERLPRIVLLYAPVFAARYHYLLQRGLRNMHLGKKRVALEMNATMETV